MEKWCENGANRASAHTFVLKLGRKWGDPGLNTKLGAQTGQKWCERGVSTQKWCKFGANVGQQWGDHCVSACFWCESGAKVGRRNLFFRELLSRRKNVEEWCEIRPKWPSACTFGVKVGRKWGESGFIGQIWGKCGATVGRTLCHHTNLAQTWGEIGALHIQAASLGNDWLSLRNYLRKED